MRDAPRPLSKSLVLQACLLVVTANACVAAAEDGELPVRNYILTSRCETALTSEHDAASKSARKKGGALNRGPGRYFLESRGIEFPYRASATLKDGGLLQVVNAPQNLAKVNDLFEKLYLDEIDLAPLMARIDLAKRQLGAEVFVPSAETLAAVKAKTQVNKPSPKAVLPFDPSTMDFERLVHGSVVYTNVKVTSVTPAWIGIVHGAGVTRVPLAEMGTAIQKRYAYDPAKAQAFLEAKREADESASQPTAPDSIAKAQAEASQVSKTESLSEVSEGNVSRSDQEAASRGSDKTLSYDRLLCRTGRVYENVRVTKNRNYRRFILTPAKEPRARGEDLEFDDAPSNLLLDFEEFDELFCRAVVANGRTQLYEFSGEGSRGGKIFQDLAKTPLAGSSFVSVPEGYLFANMNWINLPMPAVELVLPVGGRVFAVASAANLVGLKPSEWWNKNAGHRNADLPVPARLEKREPGKNAVLYSPFNPDTPLLGNTTGEMKRVWVDRQAGKRGALALVETGNGLFFGYYFEHAALEQSELTWADAVRENSSRFTLRKVSSQNIKPGESFLKLFDASARRVLGADFKEIGQLKLGGQHFRALLQRGVEAAVQDRVLPKGDGVQFPDGGIESTTSPALDIVIVTDQVDAKLRDVLPHAYVFDIESKQRVIEVSKENSGGQTVFRESRPQRRKQNEVAEVPPDLDGGLRLTDGRRIYELKPVLGGTELVVWEAGRNGLKRF